MKRDGVTGSLAKKRLTPTKTMEFETGASGARICNVFVSKNGIRAEGVQML
jgi:hypothetical protein